MKLKLFERDNNQYFLNGFIVTKVDDHYELPVKTLDKKQLYKFINMCTKLELAYLRVNNEYYKITIP